MARALSKAQPAKLITVLTISPDIAKVTENVQRIYFAFFMLEGRKTDFKGEYRSQTLADEDHAFASEPVTSGLFTHLLSTGLAQPARCTPRPGGDLAAISSGLDRIVQGLSANRLAYAL